jgi:hypothetical protein
MPLRGAWTGALTQPATGAMVAMMISLAGRINQRKNSCDRMLWESELTVPVEAFTAQVIYTLQAALSSSRKQMLDIPFRLLHLRIHSGCA